MLTAGFHTKNGSFHIHKTDKKKKDRKGAKGQDISRLDRGQPSMQLGFSEFPAISHDGMGDILHMFSDTWCSEGHLWIG
jgi:hypothetical protein